MLLVTQFFKRLIDCV